MRIPALVLACAAAAGWSVVAPAQPAIAPELAREIVAEAYVYGYPRAIFDETAKQVRNVREPAYPFAPVNQIAHAREFPGAEMRVVIRPNFDTLYSSGLMDVGPEPRCSPSRRPTGISCSRC